MHSKNIRRQIQGYKKLIITDEIRKCNDDLLIKILKVMITDGKLSPKQQHQQRPNQMGKQNNVRKMSTMPEEDGSDADGEPDMIRSSQDQDSDSPEENGRLLTPTNKKIVVTSTLSSGNGVKRSNSGNSSTDSVHEKLSSSSRGCQSGRLTDAGSREISIVQQSGRISRGMELYGRHHQNHHYRFPSMRSLKSNATDDPQQLHFGQQHHYSQQQQQQQPPATSWASIVFDGGHYGRPFPDSVSIRSLASIGMGSSDGRKLTIRRVPTSPSELLNMVHPPT